MVVVELTAEEGLDNVGLTAEDGQEPRQAGEPVLTCQVEAESEEEIWSV